MKKFLVPVIIVAVLTAAILATPFPSHSKITTNGYSLNGDSVWLTATIDCNRWRSLLGYSKVTGTIKLEQATESPVEPPENVHAFLKTYKFGASRQLDGYFFVPLDGSDAALYLLPDLKTCVFSGGSIYFAAHATSQGEAEKILEKFPDNFLES